MHKVGQVPRSSEHGRASRASFWSSRRCRMRGRRPSPTLALAHRLFRGGGAGPGEMQRAWVMGEERRRRLTPTMRRFWARWSY